MKNHQPIGVFDSGLGGLTIAKQIKQSLPNESILYFGDSRHLPYGEKSPKTIKEFSQNITQFLIENNCKAIVVACNTASSNAIDEILAAANGIPVLDVISPVAEKVAFEIHQKMGVIATKATISSGVYKKSIRKFNRHIKVVEMATPLLVPVIEEGLINSAVSKAAIENYLSQKKLENIDSIILGCTHYPLIEKEIEDYFQGKVKIVNTPKIVAHTLRMLLQKEEAESDNSTPEYHFYVSDLTPNFNKLAKKFFGKEIQLEEKILH